MHFLDRAAPILGEDGIAVLKDKTIAFAGLGGVGGGAFLALVRCGSGHFRLAENGVFDPPDMNRQAAAFGTTMGRPKLDVYMELARSINPDIEILPYPEGITCGNLDHFLEGADVYVGVIDGEKGEDVKRMTPALQEKHNIPFFTCGAVGFGAVMINFAPGGMKPNEFWTLATRDDAGGGLLPSSMQGHFSPSAMERIRKTLPSGKVPTTAIGGLAANALLANAVLSYLLAGTELVERAPVFAPQYVAVDFMTTRLAVGDVTKRQAG